MLRKGVIIKAKLIEAIEKDQWIVSFQGELLQVKNTTVCEFQKDRVLKLQVVNVNPLELKILEHKKNRLKLDVSI